MKFQNPLPITGIGDPYLLKVGEEYFLYATSASDGFLVWRSFDLQNWGTPSYCYRKGKKSFGRDCFWAPEVMALGGNYYMYYTAQWDRYQQEALRIGVAVADRPEGPFEEVYDRRPMFDFGYGALDAHVFCDDADGGKNYLYYSRAGSGHFVDGVQQAEIYVVTLGEDFVTVANDAVCILKPEQPWERRIEEHQYWNEGPFVLKHEGKYHLMYSANFYASRAYGLGAAVAEHPRGPFVKYENNPILASQGLFSGPGHNSVAPASDGKGLLCVYHAHTDPEHPSGDRQVYIGELNFVDGKLTVQPPMGLW